MAEINYEEKLKEVVVGMLKENTGQHMLDSGGAYGRHWQRNQTRDFANEPVCFVRADGKEDGSITELMVSVSLYHFMVNLLMLDEETDKVNQMFKEFSSTKEMEEESWEDCLKKYCKEQKIKYKFGHYTYNDGGECVLDQDIVYDFVESDDADFVIIRVHGGWDARSGFTAPYFFKYVESDEGIFLRGMSNLFGSCSGYTPELSIEKDLFDMPAVYCGLKLDSYDGGFTWTDGDTCQLVDLDDVAFYDPEEKCIRCKKCKTKVEFYPEFDM